MHRVWLLGAAMGIAVNAHAQITAVSPGKKFTSAELDRVFDGKGLRPDLVTPAPGRPAKKKILYAESDTPPAAPRFALDLSAVPVEFRHTVNGFEKLFHKNQEETPEQIGKINQNIRKYNSGRTFGKIPEWTYDGRPNEPIWTCLSHAAATSNDWWSQELGREIGSHESLSHGGTEKGLDPRTLELEYFKRRNSEDPDYVVPPAFIQKDPIRNTGFPYEPRGFAKLLTEGDSFTSTDPATGKKHSFQAEDSSMEGEWKQLFTNSVLRDRTPAKYAKVLAEGLKKYGIAYVQLEHTEHPRWPGAHAVVVVGYFCMEAQEELIDCATNQTDEDWGRTTYFIAHDTFGDFPASQARTGNSASTYRAVRITSIDQAIVFPHGLRVVAAPAKGTPGIWTIQVLNKGGRPVEVLSLKALGESDIEVPVELNAQGQFQVSGNPGDSLRIYVEARHYFSKDGRGRAFTLRLDAAPHIAAPLN
jgi:hypothetical protein